MSCFVLKNSFLTHLIRKSLHILFLCNLYQCTKETLFQPTYFGRCLYIKVPLALIGNMFICKCCSSKLYFLILKFLHKKFPSLWYSTLLFCLHKCDHCLGVTPALQRDEPHIWIIWLAPALVIFFKCVPCPLLRTHIS